MLGENIMDDHMVGRGHQRRQLCYQASPPCLPMSPALPLVPGARWPPEFEDGWNRPGEGGELGPRRQRFRFAPSGNDVTGYPACMYTWAWASITASTPPTTGEAL